MHFHAFEYSFHFEAQAQAGCPRSEICAQPTGWQQWDQVSSSPCKRQFGTCWRTVGMADAVKMAAASSLTLM